ncbi:MAG TPA: SDR family oxidoreductase [Geobacteraceae bacterium]|nr:SDR family oxidoreductase [Geobacteraceae bacterium]
MGYTFIGAFLCAKHATPLLRKRGGCIVNIASTRVVSLSHAMAISLGTEIRVNRRSPGWIETDPWKTKTRRKAATLSKEDHLQHPASRVVRPEDISSLVLYLVSPQASFITGANSVADGGMTMKMIYF